MRFLSSLLATVVLAGCVTRPVTAPSPDRAEDARSSRGSVATEPLAPSVVLAGYPMTPTAAADEASDDAADDPRWDIDVRSYETHERVAHYVTMFTGRSRQRIAHRLQRGTRYEPMIRASLRAGGLPEDMYYLALVESGFDNHAYSRAAAVGMWQFMAGTGRGVGLRIDPWVDERRDPVRSTQAAVRYIRELRKQFGSLYLAAAAYNGGPNRVAKGLALHAGDVQDPRGDDAFFVLADKEYLRNETREYVPQLIAAALIAKEPVRYGMELTPQPAFVYDSVRVPAATPLTAIARAAHASPEEILDLNPHLLRGMTPPRERYLVRVPVGAAAGFSEAFDALPDAVRDATRTVRTRTGDTAASLAAAHGISERTLESFNPGLHRAGKSARLVAGQEILLPSQAVAATALTIPDAVSVKQPPRVAARVTPASARTQAVARHRQHRRSGASSKAGARSKTAVLRKAR